MILERDALLLKELRTREIAKRKAEAAMKAEKEAAELRAKLEKEKERLQKEKLEKDRIEKERIEKERSEKEKLEKEKLENENREVEPKKPDPKITQVDADINAQLDDLLNEIDGPSDETIEKKTTTQETKSEEIKTVKKIEGTKTPEKSTLDDNIDSMFESTVEGDEDMDFWLDLDSLQSGITKELEELEKKAQEIAIEAQEAAEIAKEAEQEAANKEEEIIETNIPTIPRNVSLESVGSDGEFSDYSFEKYAKYHFPNQIDHKFSKVQFLIFQFHFFKKNLIKFIK